MTGSPKNLDTLKKNQPLYRQLVSQIEGQIYSGFYRPGDRLPNTEDLTSQTSLARNTVQQALSVLVSRGLIERTTGRGTFVSPGITCRTIALVSGWNFLHHDSARFLQLFADEVRIQALDAGWAVKFYLPERRDRCEKMLSDLDRDIEAGLIRAVLSVSGNAQAHQWMTEHCQAPWISKPSVPAEEVKNDTTYRGLRYLFDQTYRRIAVISHRGHQSQILTCVKKAMNDAGALDAVVEHFYSPDVSESAGLRLFRESVRKRADRFDAFLVLDDILCKGVIFGLMEAGISIPGDAGLLTHMNAGVDILSSVPLTQIQVDPADHAASALDHLYARLEGRESKVQIPLPKLIVGESCGER